MDKYIKKLKKTFCAIFRHSRIQSVCFGYWYCGRCRDQLGDSLGGVYQANDIVIINHGCKICIKNYKNLNWIDKFLVPYPFKSKKEINNETKKND